MNRFAIVTVIFLLTILIARGEDFVFTPINVSQGLSDNQIRYILQLSDGRMVFTTNGNVNLYDGARFKYLHRTSRHIYPLRKYDGFYRIYQNGDSLLWIKDTRKLMCIDLYRERYISDLNAYFKHFGIKDIVEDLFVDSKNSLWLLTSGKLWRQETSEFIELPNHCGNLQDLITKNNYLYLFFSSGEVICYDLKTRKKLYGEAAYPQKEQTTFKNTSLVVQGNDGFYQLRNGSKGGFFFYDPQKRIWRKLLETDYTLNTLTVTPDEVAYISCTHGIWMIHPRNGNMRYLPILKTVEGEVIDTEISTIFYDRQGGLWLGTINRGLLYSHPSRYRFSYIGRSHFPVSSTKDIIVQAFAEDNKGNLYVKCQPGLYLYRPSITDKQSLSPVLQSSLSNDLLKKLYPSRMKYHEPSQTASCTDIRGWIWTGTRDGLKLFKPENQEERIFYTEDGLINNFVHAIIEDKNHNVWVTTSYGLSQIKVDSVNEKIHFVNFNSFDGTLEGEYTDGAAFEATDGTLYFGGINGFNILQPNTISTVPLPFKPIFTNLFLKGEKVEAGKTYDDRIIISRTAPYTQEIELSYFQNFLTFEFSALNYQNPYQTCYRYQLEGIDTHWQETSAAYPSKNMNKDGMLRTSYTNLPPGKYTFKVMASSNNNRQWNGVVSKLNITIYAPWWKTTLANILYILFSLLAVSGSIYSYIYLSQKKIERQHKEEILLLRIRNLIEQCNQLEAEKESYAPKTNIQDRTTEDCNKQNSADNIFLTQAIEQVEKNLNVPNYSVEQLSRDLCMDRTGLYRKLISLLDKSPSLFIRNIRLQKAAQLILEEELSIAEITERVGFSSSSYLSKCFQEMYGCRPSEYVEKMKKST